MNESLDANCNVSKMLSPQALSPSDRTYRPVTDQEATSAINPSCYRARLALINVIELFGSEQPILHDHVLQRSKQQGSMGEVLLETCALIWWAFRSKHGMVPWIDGADVASALDAVDQYFRREPRCWCGFLEPDFMTEVSAWIRRYTRENSQQLNEAKLDGSLKAEQHLRTAFLVITAISTVLQKQYEESSHASPEVGNSRASTLSHN
jgi:hypothetical protein